MELLKRLSCVHLARDEFHDQRFAADREPARLDGVFAGEAHDQPAVDTFQLINLFAAAWAQVIAWMEDRKAPAVLIDEVRSRSGDDLAWLLAERRRSEADDAIKSAREVKHRIENDFVPGAVEPSADTQRPTARTRSEENPHRNTRAPDVLVPGRELADLGSREIDRRLRVSDRLAANRSEIERLSRLVYGNPAAVAPTVEGIEGVMAGSVAGQDVRTGKLGPMAGEGRGLLRAESAERQTARAHLSQLAAALEDYGRTVDFERHQVETRHRDEQQRQRQKVRALSEELTAVLQAPAHEQASRLHAAPQLRRELDGIATSINRRLTPGDRIVLKAADAGGLSTSLSISRDQAQAVLRVHGQTQAAHSQVQRQQVERSRNAAITIKR